MIPVNEPLLDGNEEKYLVECIRSGWISSEGPFVSRFENEFSAKVGRFHGIAVCNGTAALDIAIEAAGIKAGDEVILPTFTIISCIQQIIRVGANPVLVDCDPITWNMDVKAVEGKITSKTKAILVVHIYGLPVDMDPILRLAEQHDIIVIEDAAEAIGQTYKGKPCGSFGDISTFSFYPNKHITTGEGGMIVTDSEMYATECRSLRNLCFRNDQRFVHERLGWNSRMTNLQAAVGVAQLERLDAFLDIKRHIGRKYRQLLSGCEGVQLPLDKTEYASNLYWVFGIVLDDSIGTDAQNCIAKLGSLGIGCRPFFYPMHLQPAFKQLHLFDGQVYPVSERLYRRGLYIPSGLGLKDDQIEKVALAVLEVLQ